tara:strand:+ start:10426 stop:10971 length:546 start_codon:yes stop_codon:yes gene_type:complete
MEMTKADYARHSKLTPGRITQMTKVGALLHRALLPNGHLNAALADQLRNKSFDPSNNQSKPVAAPLTGHDDPSPEAVRAEEEILDFRRRSAAVKAQTDELNLEERKGTLVDRQRLKATLDDRLKVLFVNLRASKQPIVDRLIGDGLLPAEHRAAALAVVGEEVEKMIDDFRKSLTAGTTDA